MKKGFKDSRVLGVKGRVITEGKGIFHPGISNCYMPHLSHNEVNTMKAIFY